MGRESCLGAKEQQPVLTHIYSKEMPTESREVASEVMNVRYLKGCHPPGAGRQAYTKGMSLLVCPSYSCRMKSEGAPGDSWLNRLTEGALLFLCPANGTQEGWVSMRSSCSCEKTVLK